jgi:hypothetical protein
MLAVTLVLGLATQVVSLLSLHHLLVRLDLCNGCSWGCVNQAAFSSYGALPTRRFDQTSIFSFVVNIRQNFFVAHKNETILWLFHT